MDPYQTLGVARGCAAEELKDAFRAKALKAHPDRGGDAAEFVRLREAYQLIASEIIRKPPTGEVAPTSDKGRRADAVRDQPDPNWEPDLIVLDEPLPRVRPVRPPDPGWEPELVVRDEPLPRIRPPRPRDSHWKPELIVTDQPSGLVPMPAPKAPRRRSQVRDPKVLDRQYIGWIEGVVSRSPHDVARSREALHAAIGIGTIGLFLVISLCWMFWPSKTERTPTKPSELASPSALRESTPGTGPMRIPELPELPPKARQISPGEPPEPKPELPQLILPERPDSTSGSGATRPQ